MPLELENVQSGYNLSVINDNFQRIEDSWDEKLDRKVSQQGNFMEQELDMNSERIINVGTPNASTDAVRWKDIQDIMLESGVEGLIPIVQDRQVGDGATTIFNTPATESKSPTAFLTQLDGVTQRPFTDYNLNVNGEMVFTAAPPIGTLIDITYFEPVIVDQEYYAQLEQNVIDAANEAQNNANQAANSATASANSATASSNSATVSADSAIDSANSASASASSASASAASATASSNSANDSATEALNSQSFANDSANSATDSANSATDSANSATASSNSATASANSATSSASSATNSASFAAEAKDYRDQASEIAGLNDVAGAMGAVAQVYGTHDLDIPFNDSVDVTHGYGPVTFSRLSEATDRNKSGIPQTFATDTPAITSKGCAFFGDVTNHVTNWNEVPWVEATTTPTPARRLIERNVAMTPDGLMEADRITSSLDLDQQRVYLLTGPSLGNGDSWSVTVKAGVSDRVRIQTSVSSKFVTVSLVDGSVLEDSADHEVEPLVDGWFRITIFGDITTAEVVGWVQLVDSNNNTTFDGSVEPASVLICNVQRSDGAFVPPPVPTSGSTVTRDADIASIPQIGNLPKPGESFYIVADLDISSTGFQTILGKTYGTAASLTATPTSQLRLTLPDGQGSTQLVNSSIVDLRKKRVIVSYQNGTVAFYVDGVPSGSGTMPGKFETFEYDALLYLGRLNAAGSFEYPLNGYMKNFKIEHGVMTDDLAKAYGKWGD